MKTEVIITGTGCPIPDGNRAGPGALIRRGDLLLQFDTGRSTVQRLAGANVWVPELSAVFLTHYHSDHVSGLADVVLTYWNMDRTYERPPLPVVAPIGSTTEFVAGILDGWDDDIEVRRTHAHRENGPAVDLIPFEVGEKPEEVWRSGDVVVSAAPVRHEPVLDAVGFRIETPEGSIAITGDTRVCDEVATLIEGADVVVYEAMRYAAFDALPPWRGYVKEYHADTIELGAQCAELGVPTLVLTHLIPAPTTPEERQAFFDDVRGAGYEGELIVADDLDSVTLG
ncbi:MAG: MBL fold metallo-hydrolase [Acidimicrobiales bacterium]|nr:MBL fold metallo-hydrolase [Acidimicrobiales bacterium]